MATLIENVSSIKTAFSDVKTAIAGKGVTVASGTPVTEYAELINGISGGGVIDASTDYSYMFEQNRRLTALQSGRLKTSHVKNFSYFAYNSTNLTGSVSVDMSSAENAQHMFESCTSLESVSISRMSNVTSATYMFFKCTSLESVLLPDIDNITSAEAMFRSCSALKEVTIGNIGNATSTFRMFDGCTSLTTLTIGDMSKVITPRYMFDGCTSLKNLTVNGFIGPCVNGAFDVSACTLLTRESVLGIINALIVPASTQNPKLTLGETNLAKLTDEEKAIATNRRWTLA